MTTATTTTTAVTTTMKGWQGTILRIDLTDGTITKAALDPDLARRYIGGRGLNSHTLLRELPVGADPLGPENILCLAPGALTGTGLPLSSRLEVSTLSPLSGILGDGSSGGHFPTFLKRAGYDQVIITGRAAKPVYIWIDDDTVEIKPADDLWGTSTWETVDRLTERHGKGVRVVGIGPAGEHLVRFASTICDKHASAARGSGAVWGSKNLKAIAVRGTTRVAVADPDRFQKLTKLDRDFFKEDEFQREVVGYYGTHIGMLEWGPGVHYFEKYIFGDECPESVRPPVWKEYETGRYHCYGCPVGCKNRYRLPAAAGEYAGEENAALEFEAIYCLGTNSGITDPVAIMVMENLADKYGMCVIGLGNAVALAKRLYNEGLIGDEETGGLHLDWENAEAQIELIHQVAMREGFGNIVAEGMLGLAKHFGKEAMDRCYHVKGLSRGPFPAGIFALAHAVGTRGADHLRGRTWCYFENDHDLKEQLVDTGLLPDHETDPVGTLTVCEDVVTLADAIGRCKGAVTSWKCTLPLVWKYPLLDGLAQIMTAATGVEYTEDALKRAAQRIYTVERVFNLKQGITRVDDRLALRVEEQGTDWAAEQERMHQELLTEYYRLHGYDPETGVPTRERLEQLGIGFAGADLEAHRPYPAWDGPPLWDLDAYPSGGKRA